jgi:aquaporin Z
MEDPDGRPLPWPLFLSELLGTALLLLIGLSLVIVLFGAGSPVARLVPDEGRRRAASGFLFGGLGALIALSPVGRVSGAHINPVVTLAVRMGKIDSRIALGYVAAQLLGACLGVLPLLAWGAMGRSVAFGATVPGPGCTGAALTGETITTFLLITGLCVFLGFRGLRPFTPALFPFLYAAMVYVEAPLSGTSTTRPAASARRSCPDSGRGGGSIGWARSPALLSPSWPAAFSRSGSRWPRSITSTAMPTASSTGLHALD